MSNAEPTEYACPSCGVGRMFYIGEPKINECLYDDGASDGCGYWEAR